MNRPIGARALAVAAACGVGLAAASSTLTSTWKAPGEGPLDYTGKKVVALVITADDSLRMSAEEALVREISARGPQGVAAYRLIPREEMTDKDKAKGWFDRSGAAGVVALRLVGCSTTRHWHEPDSSELRKVRPDHLVFLGDAAEAEKLGFVPATRASSAV